MKRNVDCSNEPIVCFDRNVLASELNQLFKNFYGNVIINENLILDEDLSMKYDLIVMGDMGDDIKSKCPNVKSTRSIYCSGSFNARNVTIDSNLFCKKLNSYYTIVGGYLTCGGEMICGHMVVVGDLQVAGNLSCEGEMFTHDIKVVGNLACKGNMDTRYIRVGGDLACEGSMDTMYINVSGDLFCGGNINSHNHEIHVNGNFICKGKVCGIIE